MTDPKHDEAVALVTREVLCELAYRNRKNYDPEHPARSLDLRSILPAEIAPHAHVGYLTWGPDALKVLAAEVLDKILAARRAENP